MVPFALAWMSAELLTDRPVRLWPLAAIAGLAAAASLMADFWPLAALARGGLVLAVYAGIVVFAVRSDADDLVAERRLLRRGLLAGMGATGIAITAIELTGSDRALPAGLYPLQAGIFWLFGLAFGAWLLQPRAQIFAPDAAGRVPRTSPGAIAPAPPKDPAMVRLQKLMDDRIWAREGLTIADLAREVGVPEHRLRAMINRTLGWRNFSTFINNRRIREAKVQLADPARAGKSILEIAYECGFASLGPFNRAFRAETGQSPRDWRAAQRSTH
ncbi:MAG: helix-turn-helix domain-containing protein [Marinibacterium sp.]